MSYEEIDWLDAEPVHYHSKREGDGRGCEGGSGGRSGGRSCGGCGGNGGRDSGGGDGGSGSGGGRRRGWGSLLGGCHFSSNLSFKSPASKHYLPGVSSVLVLVVRVGIRILGVLSGAYRSLIRHDLTHWESRRHDCVPKVYLLRS